MKTSRMGTAAALVTMLALAAGVGPALAVHDLDFELDGNIPDDPGLGIDWTNLFDNQGRAKVPLPSGFMGTHFVRDFVPGASGPDLTTFTSGSKDTLNISTGWQCVRANNVSAKTDILNTYATFYIDPVSNHTLLYFGLERATNTGSGNIGVWFLQDPTVGCTAPAKGSAAFTGNHIDGDLFVVAEFTNGGVVNTIKVYRWRGGATGFLDPTPVLSGVDCAVTPPGDSVCAIVNSRATSPPWPTEDKDGDNVLDTSEFFEGAFNLTRLELLGCFNKALFVTRSSPSLTATLFDFTLGGFITCSDGNACTTDTCTPRAGCVFPPIPCDDGNLCTDDGCDPATGCLNVSNTSPCDDGNACTVNDTCSAGGCRGGTPRNCDDGNVCTDDSCNPVTGCVNVNNTATCDDGSACTTNDRCNAGRCVGGAAPNCNDNNPCTDDSCDPGRGCVNSANTLTCDDGDACTTNDQCNAGACVGGAAPKCDDDNVCTDDRCDRALGCVSTNNSAACNDGNACTTNDQCSAGTCVGGPAPNCNDDNPCTDDSCERARGCVSTNNTDVCDDGNACTTNDRCGSGFCVGGPAPNCNDNNPCTSDSCDPGRGCVNTNNSDVCDDGNACTTDDRCNAGACVGGAPRDCNDHNPCTDDGCDPALGCVRTNNAVACSDGNACTTDDRCSAGACVGGAALNCDDGNVCTDDDCDPTRGCVYVNNTAPCGAVCSAGQCRPY